MLAPTRRPAPTFLAAALVVALAPGGDDAPAFAPGADAVLSQAFTEETRLAMDEVEIRVDGEELPIEVPEAAIEIARRATLSDARVAVVEGKLRTLERAHDGLAAETRITVTEEDEIVQTVSSASALEGAVVRFEWDETEGRFRRSFEEGGTGDEAHLDALEPEAHLQAFLPPEAVAPGATWDVPAAALAQALAPGGDLRLVPEIEGAVAVDLDPHLVLASALLHLGEAGDAWTGDVEARYAGTVDEDGAALGRIALAIDVEAEADLLERLRAAYDLDAVEIDRYAVTWRLAAEGELLWNLAAGRAHAFRLEGALKVDATCAWRGTAGAATVAIEGRYRFEGTTRYEAKVGS